MESLCIKRHIQKKYSKRFNMAESHPLSSPMVVRSLGLDTDPFHPKMDDEVILGPEVPYLSAIGALMYLASHTTIYMFCRESIV
ncbi:hypothetical protein Bca4012_090690 [Brassica carinata]